MNLKYLFCILFIILIIITTRAILFSQENNKTNLFLIDRLVNESLIPLGNELTILGKENLYNLYIEGNDEQRAYLNTAAKLKFADYRIIITSDTLNLSDNITDSADYNIIIKNTGLRTNYSSIFTDKILGMKKLERIITVSYTLSIRKNDAAFLINEMNIKKSFKDSINLGDQNQLEDKRYTFSQDELPLENSVNNLLFPAILILSSAAAIILFFVIRSK